MGTMEAENHLVENGAQTSQAVDPEEPKGSVLEGGVECDWAYWYLPHTGTVRPARVTIRSRTRKMEKYTEDTKSAGKVTNDDKPWRKFMRKPLKEPKENKSDKDDRTTTGKNQEKPWRVNMKNVTSKADEVTEPAEDASTKKAEKPWRVNMKKESSTDKDTGPTSDEIPQPEPDVRS